MEAGRGRARTGVGLGGAVVALALASLLFEIPLSHTVVPSYVARFSLYRLVAALTFASLGAWIVHARPRNPLGWVWLLVGALNAVSVFADGYGLSTVWDQLDLPGGAWVLWIGEWIQLPAYWILPTLSFALFPDGRLLSPRWRPVAWGAAVAAVVSTVGWALLAAGESDIHTHPPGYESPAPSWSGAQPLQAIGGLIGLVAVVAAVASLVIRYHRARTVEQARLRLVAVGAAGTVVLLVGAFFEPPPGGWLIALSSIPIAMAIAVGIVRHRLWDIEVVVRRSLVYGVLTGAVIAVYGLAVVLLGSVLGRDTGAPLVATAIVAIGIQPAHRRLDAMANRLVYGYRDDPAAALRDVGERLDGATDTDVVTTAVGALARGLRLAGAAVVVDGRTIASTDPAPSDSARTVPLPYRGDVVGTLLVDTHPGDELGVRAEQTVDGLARQLAVVIHAQQLDAALRRSEEQAVLAREEERRRLRHELHDGLGPTLAAMALQIDRSRGLVAGDPATAEAILARLSDDTRRAVRDVRAVVAGLGVAELDDHGLVEALEHVTEDFRAAGLAVTLEVDGLEPIDLPAAVEVAIYRITSEAITNVARHAEARQCAVTVCAAGASIDVCIEDDGIGIPDAFLPGVGLRSMERRAAELGGGLTVTQRAAGGTVVQARIPVGAEAGE